MSEIEGFLTVSDDSGERVMLYKSNRVYCKKPAYVPVRISVAMDVPDAIMELALGGVLGMLHNAMLQRKYEKSPEESEGDGRL